MGFTAATRLSQDALEGDEARRSQEQGAADVSPPSTIMSTKSPQLAAATLPVAAAASAPKAKVDKNAAKAAKVARRAAEKVTAAPTASTSAAPARPAAARSGTAPTAAAKAGKPVEAPKTDAGPADPLQLFLHLDLPSTSSSLSHSSKASTANIHPSIIRLALQYAEFKVVGANARCIAMLEAFKDVSTPCCLLGRELTRLRRRSSHAITLHPRRTSRVTSRRRISTPKSTTSSARVLSPSRWEPRLGTSSTRSR
jgi:hypothetical protein